MKVTLRLDEYRGGYPQMGKLLIDGKVVCEVQYGGEPEDNCRYRDYEWVEVAIQEICKAAGAEFELKEEPDGAV